MSGSAVSLDTWLRIELIRHQVRLSNAIGLGASATLVFLIFWGVHLNH
ncbi:MAG: hypothetical protein R3E83_24695 [Burkholderiaceae bacterium]